MTTLEKIASEAQRSRDAAIELAKDVTAGTAQLDPGMTQQRALEILNGCIGDYNTILKRLGNRHRG